MAASSSGSSFQAPLSCCIPRPPCTDLSGTLFPEPSILLKLANRPAPNSRVEFRGHPRWSSSPWQEGFWLQLWRGPFIFFWFWIWLIRSIRSVNCSWQRRRTNLGHRILRCCTWRWLWACMDCHCDFRGFIPWVRWKLKPPQWSQEIKHFYRKKCWFCWYRRRIWFNWELRFNFKQIWNFHLLGLVFRPPPSSPRPFRHLVSFLPWARRCWSLPVCLHHPRYHHSIILPSNFPPKLLPSSPLSVRTVRAIVVVRSSASSSALPTKINYKKTDNFVYKYLNRKTPNIN